MRKTFSTATGVTLKDWLKLRPYPVPIPNYDGHYVQLANQVFNYFALPKTGLAQIFRRDDLRELAVVVTSHFEDFVNEMGIWAALRRKNEQAYGRALPFFDLEDYDPDYLNPQDFAYLIWQTLSMQIGKSMNPLDRPLLAAADHCYSFFEERIDDAPVTNFYDKWLDIKPDIQFFELKNRLRWLALENYVLGPRFGRLLVNDMEELSKNKKMMQRFSNVGKAAYAVQEDYLLKKHSPFCGMSAPEFLAEAARCPDDLRPEIRRLSQRVMGWFLYEGCDDRHYHFQFIRTKRVFQVVRESVDLDVDEMIPGKDAGMFGILPWQGGFWLSGTFIGHQMSKKEIEERQMEMTATNFYAWNEKEQAQISEITAESEQGFIEYFGDRLVFFPDQKTLSAAMQAQQGWWNENKALKTEARAKKSKHAEQIEKKAKDFDGDLGLDDSEGLAAFFAPGEGALFSSLVPEIARLMQQKELTTAESKQLFYSLFEECQPSLVHDLVNRFGDQNLRYPLLLNDPGFVQQNFLALLHFYNPEGFREVLPNMTLVLED